jgi:hypothetical protein
MVFQTSVTFDHVTSDLTNSIDHSKVQDLQNLLSIVVDNSSFHFGVFFFFFP